MQIKVCASLGLTQHFLLSCSAFNVTSGCFRYREITIAQ